MSWSSNRQFKIVGILLILPTVISVYILYKFLSIKPTCFDKKQNGTEQGIDCGGGCQLQCTEQVTQLAVRWMRSFPINENFYNAAAYIENQNTNIGIKKITYEFKLYDKDRVLIGRREGETFIEPNKGTIIFEQQISVGKIKPAYTNFSFSTQPIWYKTDSKLSQLTVSVKDQALNTEDIKPRFQATLKNLSEKYFIHNLDVIVVMYDESGNAIQVGKTTLQSFDPLEEKKIFITWQDKFDIIPTRYEVFPRFDPFNQDFSY